MSSGLAAGLFLISLPFGVAGFYLTLIAKFYRQKFKRGPSPQLMQASLYLIIGGLILKLPMVSAHLPLLVPHLLICLGSLVFSAMAYMLYRTMMTVS